jgi:nitroreductase
VVLVVCYDRDACWHHPVSGGASGVTDATIVATHMMLEATAQGLGSAWVSCFDRKRARELLLVPANWEICDMLYLGYPAEDERCAHAAGSREPLEHTCFFNEVRTGSHEQFPIMNR